LRAVFCRAEAERSDENQSVVPDDDNPPGELLHERMRFVLWRGRDGDDHAVRVVVQRGLAPQFQQSLMARRMARPAENAKERIASGNIAQSGIVIVV